MNPVIVKPSFETPSRISYHDTPRAKDLRREVARGLRMHRGLAVVVGLAAFLSVAAFALLRRPYYETSALVYVQPMKSKLVTDPSDGAYDQIRYDSYIQQQIQTILRPDTLRDAIKLAASPTYAGTDLWSLPGEAPQSAEARLEKALKVERVEGSYQLSITLDGKSPVLVMTLLNAVVDTYIQKERHDELAQNDQQLEILGSDRQNILRDLSQNTLEQAQLSGSLGVADPAGSASNSSSTPSPIDAQLNQLRTELTEARAAHAMAEAQLSSVSNSSGPNDPALDAAAEASYANDPGLAALRQTISQRKSLLATQMAGLTPTSPLYKQDQSELLRLGQSLDSMSAELRAKAAQQVLATLRLNVARTGDVEARLAAQLQQQTSAATGATPKLQRAAFLAADIARLQARFTEVDNAINALELEHKSSGLVHLLLPAEMPSKPKTSRKWFILAAAFPLGAGMGLSAAWLAYKFDSRIYIADEVTQLLGFPPMAVLPDPRGMHERVVDDFMLRLVAGIDRARASGNARTYVFTPVSNGTKITDMVVSLAAKMERLGYRTAMLKASAALESPTASAEDIPKSRSEMRIAAYTEGRLAGFRRSSFVSENLDRMKQKSDLLFIEALPLSSSAESEFAARLADVTILVVESGKTTAEELSAAMGAARRLNLSGIAAILCNLGIENADKEFAAAIRSIEERQIEVRRREEPTEIRDTFPVSTYKTPQSLVGDREASTHH